MPNDMTVSQEQIEQIANYALYEVDDKQAAAALGVDEAMILAIKDTTAYKEYYATVATEQFEKKTVLNDAWDNIEASAAQVVMDTLQFSKNPDFALRAAMVANKAQRRGAKNDHTIDGNAGVRTVINLNAKFIQRVEQINIAVRNEGPAAQKQSDFLNPKKLEEMLEVEDNTADAKGLIPAFPQFAIAGE